MEINKEFITQVRNSLLRNSDHIVHDLMNQGKNEEVSQWLDYRKKLREFFDNKPENFDYEKDLVWPKNPNDIAALKERAANGDEEASDIIKKEKL